MLNITDTFKINGFTDSHSQCDRCGRNELKGTYNITMSDGNSFHLGSSCIKSAWQMNSKEFEAAWFAPYSKRVSMAKDEWFKVVETEKDRKVWDKARISISAKYGIKSQYEL